MAKQPPPVRSGKITAALEPSAELTRLRRKIMEAEPMTMRDVPRDCSDAECNHDHQGLLFLRPECHPKSGAMTVVVEVQTGVVALFCKECHGPIAVLKIAEGAPDA